ncbi:winged helix-turn-helix domain-containing protein [uncultured Ruegeria sp.]|uniref:winged helix-turn-helix domain-containing tetratricopeptide repeat protein n=1 Tax=uncultured Ruegeria sp. TaxID=259304 RepID=UPI00260A3E5B|nr:winged helix-turn-helix domain-containing protein [uncultured Ruegeria sp.]
MIYAFGNFLLDDARRELTAEGGNIHVQPQVFDLLLLLVANTDRVISRDEIVEKVWNGRIVSDDAISSRIRDLRRILSGTGTKTSLIRTIRGKGFRFEAEVSLRHAPQAASPIGLAPQSDQLQLEPRQNQIGDRPSIAVLPFQRNGDLEGFTAIEEAIPRELIATLASLRWIRVVSHGSTFQFRGTHLDLAEIRRILRVCYCMTGIVEVTGRRITIDTEISDTRTGEVIWALRKSADIDDIQTLRAEISANIVMVAELEIPQHEASHLEFVSTDNLDAWSAMHLGFRHMSRFNSQDNVIAEQLLTRSTELDPTLARAHSGLAFVHFQNAFMRYSSDLSAEARKAQENADKSLALQPRDPFGNFMMGRIQWLNDDPEGSKSWFRQSVEASPNYTWGHYGSSWANVFTEQFDQALIDADNAIGLSPIDPFRPGMTGNKMWIYIDRDDYQKAVHWAEVAARTPWSHAGMAMFAAMSHWLNKDEEQANWWKAEALRRDPGLTAKRWVSLVPEVSTRFHSLVRQASGALELH